MKFNTKANNPLIAASYLFKGAHLLTRPELRKFIVLPILINLVLYTIALILGYYFIHELIAQMIPHWLAWLSWLLYPLFFVGFFIMGFFTFTVLANIISAPFFGDLSAKTLKVIYPDNTIASIDVTFINTMKAEGKRLNYMLTRSIPLMICSIIPALNILTPILLSVFGAWTMALEYIAYPLENRGILFDGQKELLKPIRLGILSFGGVTMFALTIPVLNIIIAPAAVIGATLYLQDNLQE